VLITDDEMSKLPFRSYRKTALLHASPLIEDDYKLRNGIIQTLEGPATFQPGDYLARGVSNEEWPITQKHFTTDYERVSEPDAEGFASYRARDVRQAYQMPEEFTLKRINGDALTGKPGDYLVKSGHRVWVTEHSIFESSHERIS